MEANIILQGTTLEALADLIDDRVKEQLEELKKSLTPTKPETLLTREQACELLQINPSTLWHWTKKGKVKCYGIANRRYYKRSELLESLTLLKK